MQPILVITAPVAGMIYLNGRFAGESSQSQPLLAPVAPYGAIYLEFRPLEPNVLSMARRIVMSGGAPLESGIPEDVYAVVWPGGITELELSPPPMPREETITMDGAICRILHANETTLELAGHVWRLPRDAKTPTLTRHAQYATLTCKCGQDTSILILSPNLDQTLGGLSASDIRFSENILTARIDHRDAAGHATLETWKLDPNGLKLISSEPTWTDGAPRPPQSPEDAALMATQATLAGNDAEAQSYLAPTLRTLPPLPENAFACLPMKYAPPQGRPCVGLTLSSGDSLARVAPLYYEGENQDGRWLLTHLSL